MSDTVNNEGCRHIHRRLSAFQKLLNHAVARFAKEEVYLMLKTILSMTLKSYHKHRAPANFKIRSILQLKEMLGDLMTHGQLHENDKHAEILKYFDTFLKQLDYLRNMKRYFDTKIFKCLCQFFYDPYDEFELTIKPNTRKTKSFDMTGESFRTHLPAIKNTRQNSHVGKNGKSDKEKFSDTVSELYDINRKWERLLHEDVFNLNDFDPESHKVLLEFADYTPFEQLLRLIPEIHSKCRRAMNASKVWATLAKRIYKEIPVPRTVPGDTDAQRELAAAERRLHDFDGAIKRSENQMEFYKKEVEDVATRDARFSQLSTSAKKINHRIAKIKNVYDQILSERQIMLKQMHQLKHGSKPYLDLRQRMVRLDKDVANKLRELKTLEHEKIIVQGDIAVEENGRTDLREYRGYLQDKIRETNTNLENCQRHKLILEKKIILLKTNTEDNRQNLVSANPETVAAKNLLAGKKQKTTKNYTTDSGFLSDGELDDIGHFTVVTQHPTKHRPSRLPLLQKTYSSVR